MPAKGKALHIGSSAPRSSALAAPAGAAKVAAATTALAIRALRTPSVIRDRHAVTDPVELPRRENAARDQVSRMLVGTTLDDPARHGGRDARQLLEGVKRAAVQVGRGGRPLVPGQERT